MKYYFIVNPNSGSGLGLRTWNRVKYSLEKHGIEYEMCFTSDSRDTSERVRKLTDGGDTETAIIIIGGDGTYNDALNGIVDMNSHRFGFLRAGSGNDFARNMGFRKNVIREFRRIHREERVEALDYGVVTCGSGEHVRRFINSSGIGFDAAICAGIEAGKISSRRNKRLKSAYIVNGLRELFFSKPTSGYIILDGTQRVEFNNIFFISAHIHPYEGGGFRFADYADPKDGLLELCVVSTRSRSKLARILIKAKAGLLRNCACVRMYQCHEAQVHLDTPSVVHADGNVGPVCRDLSIRCVRQQLNVLR